MTPIPGPLILLAVPLLAAVIAFFVRRWATLAALVSAATTASLTLLCLRLPLDRSGFVLGREVAFGLPVNVTIAGRTLAGRTLMLDATGQMWLAFVFAMATVVYLLAWRAAQGRLFFSISLVVLSLYALCVLLQTFSLALLAFAISSVPAVFMILGDRPGSVRGAQRYLLVTVLCVPLLLASWWLVDRSLVNPENAEMLRLAVLPLALGFALLLAVFPFGTWVPALAADAPPMVSTFLFAAGQAMAVYLALTFLRRAPWPLDASAALDLVQFAGLVTVAGGGLMAVAQRDFGRIFGYAVLSDLGYLLLACGVGRSQGLTLALLHTVNRAAPIALMAMALAVLRRRTGTDAFADLTGMARRWPVITMGLMLGGLALAGFPMTAGFPTHWAITRAVATEHWPWAVVLIGSEAGILIGLLRGLSAMLGASATEDISPQPILASLLVVAVGAAVIVLGLYPQLLLGPISSAVKALALF